MSHTGEFNRIMQANKPQRKEKLKPIIETIIQPRDNMNALQTDLSKCTIAGNIVRLPFEQLPNYAEVRKALLNAGATYNRSIFVFPNDAKPYIDRLMGGESVNIKKEFQFFPTPAVLAEEMAAFIMQNFDPQSMTILEPSAGQGALVSACFDHCTREEREHIMIHGFELMDVNRAVLGKIKDFILLGNDFLTEYSVHKYGGFDRIIANPPFSKNQDIEHIRRMYFALNKGGRIVTIASNSWRTGSQKKQIEFRNWLDEIGATVDDIEAGTFNESGTNIDTCMIIIDK
jgi:phospholipid N-methyltransferase